MVGYRREEAALSLQATAPFEKFSEHIAQQKQALLTLLEQLKQEGLIRAYGVGSVDWLALLDRLPVRHSDIQNLITDCLGTPKRPASWSRDSIIQIGKSTLTR